MATCVVSVSGGASSAVALERAIQQFDGDIVAVFADTKQEDQDLYRFLADVERHLGITIVRLADGRDVWQVFRDERFIANTRVDLCSRILKRDLIRKYVEGRWGPNEAVMAFGMGPKEMTRTERLASNWAPYRVWNPLQSPPFLDRCQLLDYIRNEWDLDPPRLYDLGFPHNNCGGACVKAGHGGWYHTYRKLPSVFADWMEREALFRSETGEDVAILRDRRGGETKPMTLAELKRRFEEEGYAPSDWGDACNCMGN